MKANIFATQQQSQSGQYGSGFVAIPDTYNGAGAPAFTYDTATRQLTQLVCCGTLSDTFYVTAEVQLKDILGLAKTVDNTYICKLALYAKTIGKMRATSALLTTILAVKDPAMFKRNANELLDFRALRTFCKIIRSGVLGKRSFGSTLRNVINDFLENQTEYQLLMGNIGNDPSLADIIKMTHPKPKVAATAQLFNWFVKSKRTETVHPSVQMLEDFTNYLNQLKAISNLELKIANNDFAKFTTAEQTLVNNALANGELEAAQKLIEGKRISAQVELNDCLEKVAAYKANQQSDLPLPNLPFEYLKTLPLSVAHWARLVERLTYNQLRKSIATISRTGVLNVQTYANAEFVKDFIINRLLNPTAQELSKFKPVDLLVTASVIANNKFDIAKDVTRGDMWVDTLVNTLYGVVQRALANAPTLKGKTLIAIDCSGSMHVPIASNGNNKSTLTRLDASALLGVGLWHSNPNSDFITYGTNVKVFSGAFSPYDSFKTLTQQIRNLDQGGTDTSLVFQFAHMRNITDNVQYDNIVIISDNESWSGAQRRGCYSQLLHIANEMGSHYTQKGIKVPKVFNVDVDPTACSHLPSSPNTFTIGGMDDYVYDLIKAYSETNNSEKDYWVEAVNKVIIK